MKVSDQLDAPAALPPETSRTYPLGPRADPETTEERKICWSCRELNSDRRARAFSDPFREVTTELRGRSLRLKNTESSTLKMFFVFV
jgi:hypothetical protein